MSASFHSHGRLTRWEMYRAVCWKAQFGAWGQDNRFGVG